MTGDKQFVVLKFGGTSVGSADRIANAAKLSLLAVQRCGLVVVSSAMSGVTDVLVGAAEQAAAGQLESATADFATLRARHHETAAAVALPDEVEALQAELGRLLDDPHDPASFFRGESREFAGGSVGIQAMHAALDQPVDIPPKFRFVDLALVVERNHVGREDSVELVSHGRRRARGVRKDRAHPA